MLGGGSQHYNGKGKFLHTNITLLGAPKGLKPAPALAVLAAKMKTPSIY